MRLMLSTRRVDVVVAYAAAKRSHSSTADIADKNGLPQLGGKGVLFCYRWRETQVNPARGGEYGIQLSLWRAVP